MQVIKFETLQSKLIQLRDTLVLVDKDVAELFGVETRDINKAVKNNPFKFPEGYLFEVSSEEFEVLRGKFSTAKFAKTRTLPKAFTEKGLYMIATILKSEIATSATLQIIETFANLKQLSRNLNAINEDQTKEEQLALIEESNVLLEKVIDIEPVIKLQDDETEIETKIELNLGFVKVSRIVKTKKSKEDQS